MSSGQSNLFLRSVFGISLINWVCNSGDRQNPQRIFNLIFLVLKKLSKIFTGNDLSVRKDFISLIGRIDTFGIEFSQFLSRPSCPTLQKAFVMSRNIASEYSLFFYRFLNHFCGRFIKQVVVEGFSRNACCSFLGLMQFLCCFIQLIHVINCVMFKMYNVTQINEKIDLLVYVL